nr:uncharacterized protein LOC111513840 [Leptinotarsa decemlineata]
MSPLEFRNTDLVSRLLAATPPYLYNMSLLPNTYFFSEMLRSLVHAKTERNAQMQPPIRRSRKRSWASSRSEGFIKANVEPKSEDLQETSADWMLKSNRKPEENPLELTINKTENSEGTYQNNSRSEPHINEQMFPNIHPSIAQEGNIQNLVLPPPPPMWYPPLYPTPPYGIDPLHFFIDLRVSGHIYDRKDPKEVAPPLDTFSPGSSKEKLPHTEVSEVKNEIETKSSIFRQPRHCSAFSVPVPTASKGLDPVNITDKENRSTKFDVKSMGFDKSTNKTSTTYIMSNLTTIYKNVGMMKEGSKDNPQENLDETEEEREKRVKDLRALIGLELVVDYMKHKPTKSDQESFSSTDGESIGSPTLEVVALQDEN